MAPSAIREADAFGGFFLLIIGAFIYFIPYIVAVNRQHHNQTSIGLLNLFFGWTVIGWVGALIWATTNPPPGKRS